MGKKDNKQQRRITMRKIVASEYVSLDGVMEELAWTRPYWNDEIAKFKLPLNPLPYPLPGAR
jgi:hypothetical protein